jgi:hypothetical protein
MAERGSEMYVLRVGLDPVQKSNGTLGLAIVVQYLLAVSVNSISPSYIELDVELPCP